MILLCVTDSPFPVAWYWLLWQKDSDEQGFSQHRSGTLVNSTPGRCCVLWFALSVIRSNLMIFFLPVSSCVAWQKESDGLGFSLQYPGISCHAISRDLSSFPHECLYLMIDGKLPGEAALFVSQKMCVNITWSRLDCGGVPKNALSTL